ncbi:MTMR4 family protein [Megaselia abdita]
MEGSEGSPPPSMCMIRAAELFPKQPTEKEDNQIVVHFQELAGEYVRYLGRTDDGVLALSNYRIFLQKNANSSETSVPLGLIEMVQCRDLFQLLINCKDASTVKCSFETAEQCMEWQRRITLFTGVPPDYESLFAFPFYSWTSDSAAIAAATQHYQQNNIPGLPPISDNIDFTHNRLQRARGYEDDFYREVERLQFDLNGTWRISNANKDFKLCPSYPQMILVPCCISDDTLENVAKFRGSRRLPAVVWRHKRSGAVLARCSQPEVGWLGWRNSNDEQLLKALADACAFDRGEQNRRINLFPSGESTPSSPEGSHEEVAYDEVRKVLIVDARSYTSAVTNRARGGGCECIEYYPCAEIEFMNLGNIHVIRKSFHALRQLCAQPPDAPNWLGSLEKTMWLNHLSGLLAASVTVIHAIDKKGRPVLVHCSDGWDRTPQIVATAQLCLDPFYRTVEGFRILIEREWLQYGHKFADRVGHGPGSDEPNERCPVFLQWLDLVHQIHRQFPCSFEFSMGYLIKLAQHSHSCLFGTFLCNTLKERLNNTVFDRTFSVWPFLSGPMYRNPLYSKHKDKVLWPAHNVRDLYLWTDVYLGSLGNQNPTDFPPSNETNGIESTNHLTKTRSYGDLLTAGVHLNGLSRRSSDPNMAVDSSLIDMTPTFDQHSKTFNSFTSSGDNDILQTSNIIANTTEQLQHLTNELIRDEYGVDEELCKVLTRNGFKSSEYSPSSSPRNSSRSSPNLEMTKNEQGIDNCDETDYRSLADPRDNTLSSLNDILDSIADLNNTSTNSSETRTTTNPWHGSVTTSTDTLVPTRDVEQTNGYNISNNRQTQNTSRSSSVASSNSSSSRQNNILPEVHCSVNSRLVVGLIDNVNCMEESIQIRPEHQKLEISSSGSFPTASVNRRRRISSQSSTNSNKTADFVNLKAVNGCLTNGSVHPRFSSSGIRSLPLTPSGCDRQAIPISCPDGLAHALSEQNIRLQQIVYEHSIKVETLLREIQGMRLALLKKTCPNCNTIPNVNPDDQSSALDNVENSSVCSWEPVEEKSCPSSCASSLQPGGNSVLWVPDHAVSKCTICQTEFWLGRRKHHCRSCGQIFCADCSEFWAPLPDEGLFNSVRLCGPCYHSVTTRMNNQIRTIRGDSIHLENYQAEQQNESGLLNNALRTSALTDSTKSSSSSSSASSPASSIAIKVAASSATNTTTTQLASTAPIACKQAAASPPGNNVEHGTFKATATSN